MTSKRSLTPDEEIKQIEINFMRRLTRTMRRNFKSEIKARERRERRKRKLEGKLEEARKKIKALDGTYTGKLNKIFSLVYDRKRGIDNSTSSIEPIEIPDNDTKIQDNQNATNSSVLRLFSHGVQLTRSDLQSSVLSDSYTDKQIGSQLDFDTDNSDDVTDVDYTRAVQQPEALSNTDVNKSDDKIHFIRQLRALLQDFLDDDFCQSTFDKCITAASTASIKRAYGKVSKNIIEAKIQSGLRSLISKNTAEKSKKLFTQEQFTNLLLCTNFRPKAISYLHKHKDIWSMISNNNNFNSDETENESTILYQILHSRNGHVKLESINNYLIEVEATLKTKSTANNLESLGQRDYKRHIKNFLRSVNGIPKSNFSVDALKKKLNQVYDDYMGRLLSAYNQSPDDLTTSSMTQYISRRRMSM